MSERQPHQPKMKAAIRTLQRWGREYGTKAFLLSLKKLTNHQAYKLLVNRGYEWRDQRWQMTPKYLATKRKLKSLGLFAQYAGQSADSCYRALLRRHYWYTNGKWDKRDKPLQVPSRRQVPIPEPVAAPQKLSRAKAAKKPAPAAEVDIDRMSPEQLHAYIVANADSIRVRPAR